MEGHAPLLATLDAAPLRIKADREEKVFAVSGGVLRVSESGVEILARVAVAAAEIDETTLDAQRAALSAREVSESERREAQAFLDVQERVHQRHE